MDVSGTIGAVLNQKSREIYSVSPDATVFEAVQLMDAKNVGALLVMDGERLVGVISERDYTRKIMFSIRPSTGTFTFSNIVAALRASIKATSCGVVTMIAPDNATVCTIVS